MGFLHVYTGNGKGKTTCAVGMAIRAAGAGMRVAFFQFDKGYDGKNEHYNERHILRRLEKVDLFTYGAERMMPDGKFRFKNEEVDLAEAAAGLSAARAVLLNANEDPSTQNSSEAYSLIILDEIITSVGTGLLTGDQAMELVTIFKQNPIRELVLTGRGAWPELISQADLVTEMNLVKHYWYEHQPPPRAGIDF